MRLNLNQMAMKRVISVLATLLCMLVVGFAVFMGAFAISIGTGDEFGITLTWWAAMFDLMLLIIVLILLIGAIAFHVLADPTLPRDQQRGSQLPVLDESSYDESC